MNKKHDNKAPAHAYGVPSFVDTDKKPLELNHIRHGDGRMTSHPPCEHWDDWTEWDAKSWPKQVAKNYQLVPTVCFNCESACGLLAYVDKQNFEIRKFEGNPVHPGSRGRNCAKGPATHNQIYDPERIMHPLKRVGKRGEGKWKRITWDEALAEIGEKMAASRKKRKDGICYHVGRPGEDHYTNRVIKAWGTDSHNSHTNICSAAARSGYFQWSGFDRPSPDYSNAKTILLISSHLETGHYFNPHAQRIIEAKMKGAKLITVDPRLSNTASKSDIWAPVWPGSEPTMILSIANYLLENDLYDKDFVRSWVNWADTLKEFSTSEELANTPALKELQQAVQADAKLLEDFDTFDKFLKATYAPFDFDMAAKECQVDRKILENMALAVAECEGKLSTHVWRAASMAHLGGWQVARTLFFLNVLTGSIGNNGGVSGNSWNKFVPKPFDEPPHTDAWNELHMPHEWPLSFYEMSFLLPHFLEEGRGEIDVYFTRVYNPLWINPDGFMWMKALQDEEKMKCHVALTPTWNESAWYADYILPMGHAGERHDLMSQETHRGQWIAFRQPVRRVAMEKAGIDIKYTYESNPGEVWEEAEFWTELSVKMDEDGSLGIKKHFMSPYREGETITQNEYWRWIFENSVPGLPETAKAEGLTPLEYMRRYAVYEVKKDITQPFAADLVGKYNADSTGRAIDEKGAVAGNMVDGVAKVGFGTPSKKLEFFSATMKNWGWHEKEYTIPWQLESHVHQSHIDREKGEMILLPNFRLPTLIHTRSANCKWLYEISHNNPLWIHPSDAKRIGVAAGDLVRVETEIGYFVDKAFVTEGIKPGVVACSHHLGRWKTSGTAATGQGIGSGMASVVDIEEKDTGECTLKIKKMGGPWKSWDPDTSRVWWEDVGVNQNLTHAAQPDPVSGAHCWHQKALNVKKAEASDSYGDVWVDTNKSMEVYQKWVDKTRSAIDHSPDGTRRPMWYNRPLKPTKEGYKLPEKPFGRK